MTSTDYSSVNNVRCTRSTSRQNAQISALNEKVTQLEKEVSYWKAEYNRISEGRDDIMDDISSMETVIRERFEDVGRIITDFQRRNDEMITKKDKWKRRAKAFERVDEEARR